MPRKDKGMWYEVHPSPKRGEDGKNLVYVRPMSGRKVTMEQIENYCEEHFYIHYGEISRAFSFFMRAAAMLLADGNRIDTPIGSFAPKLSLRRQVTDASEVKDRDVQLEGVEYNPGKLWEREIGKWLHGFRCHKTPDRQEIMADKQRLEQVMRDCIQRHHGYITAGMFSRDSGLTVYSARKQLNEWTLGDRPKLLKSTRGKQHIYTEI